MTSTPPDGTVLRDGEGRVFEIDREMGWGDQILWRPAVDIPYRVSDLVRPVEILAGPMDDGGDDEFREGDEETEWKPLGLISQDGLTG